MAMEGIIGQSAVQSERCRSKSHSTPHRGPLTPHNGHSARVTDTMGAAGHTEEDTDHVRPVGLGLSPDSNNTRWLMSPFPHVDRGIAAADEITLIHGKLG